MNFSNFQEKTKVWHISEAKKKQKETLGNVLLNALDQHHSKILQICDNKNSSMTGSDLRQRSIIIAENLLRAGYRKNDVVTIAAKQTENLSSIIFGCILIGAPVNCLDPLFMEYDLNYVFATISPKLIICDYECADLIKSALSSKRSSTPVITIGQRVDGTENIDDYLVPNESEKSFDARDLVTDSQAIAAILMTPGTTGPSKPVILTHDQILQHFKNIIILETPEIYCSFNSLFWLTGFAMLISGAITGSLRIITNQPFSPALMFQLIEKYAATIVILPASQIVLMLADRSIKSSIFDSVKFMISGGCSIREGISTAIQGHLQHGRFVLQYVMLEYGGVMASSANHRCSNSVGVLVPGTMMKVVNESGKLLGIGEKGELCVKAEDFLGYYGDIQATNDILDADNWLHTGDFGFFDEHGFLHVYGRLHDIIYYNDHQINPAHLEDIINAMPGVGMACVVGIPDGERRSLPAAVVVKSASADITTEDIVRHVNEFCTDFHRLRGGAYFMDCFPMTSNGKMIRRRIKEYAIEQYVMSSSSNFNLVRDNSDCC